MIKKFISLTKPGIIFGNLITGAGGFFLASKGIIDYSLLIYTLLGITLIIACGCVLNNCIDQDIDKLMQRTKNRVLAKSEVSTWIATVYAILLGIAGSLLIYFKINLLTLIIALIGLFVYVVIYTMWLKRSSIHSTLVGGIAGSTIPVIGYCSVKNQIDSAAIILFLILSTWQMPHAFAIAIYRIEDFTKAKIAVLPVLKNIAHTKIQILVYFILYTIVASSLYSFGYTGKIYLITLLVINILWLKIILRGFQKFINNQKWARQVFLFSILSITTLSFTMSIKFSF